MPLNIAKLMKHLLLMLHLPLMHLALNVLLIETFHLHLSLKVFSLMSVKFILTSKKYNFFSAKENIYSVTVKILILLIFQTLACHKPCLMKLSN